MPQGRFTIRDIIGVNPKINLRKLKLQLPIKGWTFYPKNGDFSPGQIREDETYDTKIFMRHIKGFIICREHKKKNCLECKNLKP